MQKSVLEELYSNHHQKGNRYGYLFCHGARSPFLKKWIGTGKRVLDLGCRDGMLTQCYRDGNEVTGADIDQQALALAKERLGIQTEWVDLNSEWIWKRDSFDCIVACEIVEHLFFMDQFLLNVSRTLKKNGIFIGSVPNAFRVRNRWKFLLGREYETDETHVRQFSYKKLETVLKRYFNEIELVPLEGKILPFWPVSANSSTALGKLFAKDLLWRVSDPKCC